MLIHECSDQALLTLLTVPFVDFPGHRDCKLVSAIPFCRSTQPQFQIWVTVGSKQQWARGERGGGLVCGGAICKHFLVEVQYPKPLAAHVGKQLSSVFWWLSPVGLYSLYKILNPKRRIESYSILGTIISPKLNTTQ